MKKIFFILLTVFPHIQSQTPLTLEDARSLGLKSRSSLKAITSQIKSIKNRQKAALARWLPQHQLAVGIDHASGTNNLEGTIENTGTPAYFEFSTRQLLASGVSPRDTNAILEHERLSVKAEESLLKDSIRFAIEKSFLETWLINQQQKSIEYLARSAQTVFNEKKAEYCQELHDQPTWYSIQANFFAQATQVHNYPELYKNAYAELLYAMGILEPIAYTLIWEPTSLEQIKPYSWYQKQALKHRKELAILEQKMLAKDKEIAKTLKNYLPSVSAFATVSLQDGHPGAAASTKNGGLELAWRLGDGVSYYFEAESLRALKAELEYKKRSLIKQIVKEVRQAYNSLIIETRKVCNQGAQLRAAHAQLKKELHLNAVEMSTEASLDQAKTIFEQARFAWITQRVTYEIAQNYLNFVSGYPA